MLFSCSYDDTIKAWKYDESVDDWVCAYTIEGHTSTIWSLDFDSTEKFLVSVGDDKNIKIYEISETGSELKSSTEGVHSRCIYSTSWGNSSNKIATCGGDNKIYLLDPSDVCNPTTVAQSPPSEGHKNDVNCVSIHPNANTIASCSDDRTIKIWTFS